MARSKNVKRGEQISVRSGAGGYVAAALAVMFLAALVSHIGYAVAAVAVCVSAWITVAVLAFRDRVVADGRFITRTGLMPRFASLFTGRRLRLRLCQIEQVETMAVQRFKRGGSVFYAYRTTLRGRNAAFTVPSNRGGYGRMINAIFPKLADDVLDNRSIELRDHFTERQLVRRRAAASGIPRGDVLEGTFRSKRPVRERRSESMAVPIEPDPDKAAGLRKLANELRVAGFLVQSLETFRRAILLQPQNGWLLFEFGRCMLSFAASERDNALERRAFAIMRLAEQRAGADADLLSRLGESYFHAGNWRRAAIVFRRSVETVGVTFRAVRGQAEIALREGKFAHVIHNFSTAQSLTEMPALKRWANTEIEYFSRLNADEEYMELEISRLNLIDTLQRLSASTLKIAVAGLFVILGGTIIEEPTAADLGWAISTISLIVWIGAKTFCGILSSRIPIDTVTE
ncbi:MAG TPA: hypothetical protein VK468_11955 [Pyrinomonadaceae bacterium]|nr:hypothetical protein [Pyrinomonadaceae bacterium]